MFVVRSDELPGGVKLASDGAEMKHLIRKLDAEYAFGLTEEEVELIARPAEESARLYQKLYEVDIADESPVSTTVAGEKE